MECLKDFLEHIIKQMAIILTVKMIMIQDFVLGMFLLLREQKMLSY